MAAYDTWGQDCDAFIAFSAVSEGYGGREMPGNLHARSFYTRTVFGKQLLKQV